MLYHWLRQIHFDYIHCLLVSLHTAVRLLNEGLMWNWALPVSLFHPTFTTKALPWEMTVRVVSLITGFRAFQRAIRKMKIVLYKNQVLRTQKHTKKWRSWKPKEKSVWLKKKKKKKEPKWQALFEGWREGEAVFMTWHWQMSFLLSKVTSRRFASLKQISWMLHHN